MGQLCCFPFSREEEKISKEPIGIQDLLNEALHRERMRLKAKVKQIKELLLKPETQAKIRRELFEGRLINSHHADDVDWATVTQGLHC